MNILVLMADNPSLFSEYPVAKPMIDVLGKPMLQHVLDCTNPSAEHKYIFVATKSQMPADLYTALSANATVITVPDYRYEVSAAIAAEGLINNDEPLLVIPSDQLITIKIDDFIKCVENADGGVLTFPSNREDCAYVEVDSTGKVLRATETPMTRSGAEHATVGIYYFKMGSYLVSAAYEMMAKNIQYGGQMRLASACNELAVKGANIIAVEIDANWTYSLRTPEYLKWYIGIQTNKPEREFTWWKNHIYALGVDGFFESRKRDWENFSRHLPALKSEVGKGLDLGSGPRSVLEFSGLTFTAQDPLTEYYKQLVEMPSCYTSEYPDEQFDWILFTNVIDHTLEPEGLIKYIYDHLKVGGRLYLEVNFDYALTAPHYMLWDIETVRKYFGAFEVLTEHIDDTTEQYRKYYWAVLRRN